MNGPLVSVLIPAYNAAPWIRRTIESALAQTWPNTEVIVVDDGSTDETAAVVRGMGAPTVQLVQQQRRGPSAAQNEALRHARGEFIQRLDADDLLGTYKIARQMDRLQGQPRAIAAGQWARFYGDPAEARFAPTRVSEDLEPLEWLRRECTGGLPMLQPALWLAPRRLVDEAGPWDERLTLNNDFDHGVRLLLAGERVLFCEGAHVYYRSGNPRSLASIKSPAAWASTLLSIELGCEAMLRASSGPGIRAACADLFQQLLYDAYLEAPEVAEAAETHVRRLGGSTLEMDGGVLFRAMRAALGWRSAKRVKRLVYRAGYRPAMRAKAAVASTGDAR